MLTQILRLTGSVSRSSGICITKPTLFLHAWLTMISFMSMRNASSYYIDSVVNGRHSRCSSTSIQQSIIHTKSQSPQPLIRDGLITRSACHFYTYKTQQWRLYWKANADTNYNKMLQHQKRNFVLSFSSVSGLLDYLPRRNSISNEKATSRSQQLQVHTNIRDADVVEMMIGGERYSLIPMPEKMKSTTVFVGNLCEFVQDKDLSSYFSQVSSLAYVPSCVVRKVNTQSMGYGFVSFPNEEEKEAAILRFHDSEWRGKRIKVEAIREDNSNVVRIPEYMVDYVCGPSKKSFRTNDNNMEKHVPVQRISKDDVERLSRGQPSKKRGYGSRNVPHRLNDEERQEFDRAIRKGYLTLSGNGNRRTRKGSPLKNIHRQWCDARDKPQILLYKAVGGNAVDELIIDLSPLRLHGLFDTPKLVEDFLIRWKAQILKAAYETGMELSDYSSSKSNDEFDDECETYSSQDDEDADCVNEVQIATTYTITLQAMDQQAWATNPIWQLPVVSLGTFQGERSKAKTMASTLAKIWDIPEVVSINAASSYSGDNSGGTNGHGPKSRRDAGAKHGGHTKVKGLQEHRKRGGGHRQAW